MSSKNPVVSKNQRSNDPNWTVYKCMLENIFVLCVQRLLQNRS